VVLLFLVKKKIAVQKLQLVIVFLVMLLMAIVVILPVAEPVKDVMRRQVLAQQDQLMIIQNALLVIDATE